MLKDFVIRFINSTVGEYFENVDASQLQLSVFGGDVSLNDLTLKPNIFSSLGLPFRICSSRCGTLTLKIPWTSLYSTACEITLQNVFLLVIPDSNIAYDPKTEEEMLFRQKMKIVESIEAAAQLHHDTDRPDSSSFWDRLNITILRNLQIKIETIHVRYEDRNANFKYGLGAVLSNLSILTTDADWKVKYNPVHDNFVHKIVNLEGLALYWNSHTHHFSESSNENEMVEKLKDAMRPIKKALLDFMIGPIKTTTKMTYTLAPEKGPNPYSTPRMVFETIVNEVVLGMNKNQFLNLIKLAESMEFIYRRQLHKKFRPTAPYRGHYKQWWHFAYNCILEEIQRKRNNFRWTKIKQNRKDTNDYYNILHRKLTVKLTADQEEKQKMLEERLTIFNIVRVRKQVNLHKEKTRNSSWFSSWFANAEVPDERIFLQELTPEEKQSLEKLLKSRGATNFPESYEIIKLNFFLENLTFKFKGASNTNEIMNLQVSNFQMFYTLHAGSGFSFQGELHSITTFGSSQNLIVSTFTGVDMIENNLIEFKFEKFKNIEKFHFRGEPLEIVYDYDTFQNLIDCFKVEENVSLQMLQAKALEKYKDFKEISKKSFRKSLKENRFEIDLEFVAPHFLFPDGGKMIRTKPNDLLTVQLGQLQIKSFINSSGIQTIPFDTFKLTLKDFLIFFKPKVQKGSELLKCGTILVLVDQCITQNIDIPKLKISTQLPTIDFIMRESRLVQVVKLITRLPIPCLKSDTKTLYQNMKLDDNQIDSYLFPNSSSSTEQFDLPEDSDPKHSINPSLSLIQRTNLELKINIDQIRLFVKTSSGSKIFLKIKTVGLNMTSKTFGTAVDIFLFEIYLKSVFKNNDVNLVKTQEGESLVRIHYFFVSPDCPTTTLIKQHVSIEVGEIEVVFLKEVVEDFINFMRKFSSDSEVNPEDGSPQDTSAPKEKSISVGNKLDRKPSKEKNPKTSENEILLKMEAQLKKFGIVLSMQKKRILGLNVQGLNCSFIQKPDKLDIFLKLNTLFVANLDPNCLYKKILTVDADKVVFIHLTIYDHKEPIAISDLTKCNLRIKIETGSPYVVILSSTINDLNIFSQNFKSSAAASHNFQTDLTKASQSYNSSRISIEITIAAPKIILPQSDTNPSAIVLDFGNLNLKNRFNLLRGGIVEEMDITLDNVKITRQIYDKFQKSVCSISLLDPVQFTAKFRRNLSHSKTIPDYYFNGRLPSAYLSLSSEDYHSLMDAITDKLDAMDTTDVNRTDSVESKIGLFALEKLQEMSETIGQAMTISFELSLNNLGAALYEGSSGIVGKVGNIPRNQKLSLAQLFVDHIRARVIIEDKNTFGELTLYTITLKDTRLNKAHNSSNIIQIQSNSQDRSPMLQVTYRKNPKENGLDIKTTSLTASLSLDHIFQINRFFTSMGNQSPR